LRFRIEHFLFVLGCGAAALAFFHVGVVAAAIVYAAAFLLIAMQDPRFALMLILAAAPFQQDLSGGGPVKFSLSDVNLALTLPVFFLQQLIHRGRLSLGPITAPVFLYLGICLVSSWLNWRGMTTAVSFVQMVEYLVVAVMLFSTFTKREEDLLFALKGLVVVCMFLAIVVIASGSYYVLGLHKNGIGRSLASGLIVCTELWCAADPKKRKWWLVAMAIVGAGLFFSLSRGAWLGAFCGLLMVFVFRRKFKFLLWFGLLMVPLIAYCWRFLPQDLREYAVDLDPQAYQINIRLVTLEFVYEKFKESPVYGIGLGFRKEFDAVNVFMSTMAETGIIGLVAFLLVYFVFFRMAWRIRRHLSQKDPLFSIMVIGSSLMMGVLAHGSVDHYWSRGGSMIAWAGAGMAISVYYAIHQRFRTKY